MSYILIGQFKLAYFRKHFVVYVAILCRVRAYSSVRGNYWSTFFVYFSSKSEQLTAASTSSVSAPVSETWHDF